MAAPRGNCAPFQAPAAAQKLDRLLDEAVAEGKRGRPMSKLQNVSERIKDTKRRLDDEADKLALRLDKIDKDSPAAFARAHRHLDEQQADVTEIEKTLSQLSNLPLEGSPGSGQGSGG